MINEKDIKITYFELEHGEIEIRAELDAFHSGKVFKKDKHLFEKYEKLVKEAFAHRLWGERNEELRKWILEQEYIVRAAHPGEDWNIKRKFFAELLEKIK
jgi:hypothetical protein